TIKAGRILALTAIVAAVTFGAGAAHATASPAEPVQAVMILLDVNTTFPADGVAAEDAAATAYLNALPAGVSAGLITFYGNWNLVTAPTTNRQTVEAAISSAPRAGEKSVGLPQALAGAQSALSALGASVDARILVLSNAEEVTGTIAAPGLPVDVVPWAF